MIETLLALILVVKLLEFRLIHKALKKNGITAPLFTTKKAQIIKKDNIEELLK